MAKLEPQTFFTGKELHELHPEPFYKLFSYDFREHDYRWYEGRNKLPKDEIANFKKYKSYFSGLNFTDYQHLNCGSAFFHDEDKYKKIGKITVIPDSLVFSQDLTFFTAFDVVLSDVMPIEEFLKTNMHHRLLKYQSIWNRCIRSKTFINNILQNVIENFLNDDAKKDSRINMSQIADNIKNTENGLFCLDNVKRHAVIEITNVIVTNKLPITYFQNISASEIIEIFRNSKSKITTSCLQYIGIANNKIVKLLIKSEYFCNIDENFLIDDEINNEIIAQVNKVNPDELNEMFERLKRCAQIPFVVALSTFIEDRIFSHLPTPFVKSGFTVSISLLEFYNIQETIAANLRSVSSYDTSKSLITILQDLVIKFSTNEIDKILHFLEFGKRDMRQIANIVRKLKNLPTEISQFVDKYRLLMK